MANNEASDRTVAILKSIMFLDRCNFETRCGRNKAIDRKVMLCPIFPAQFHTARRFMPKILTSQKLWRLFDAGTFIQRHQAYFSNRCYSGNRPVRREVSSNETSIRIGGFLPLCESLPCPMKSTLHATVRS